MAEGSGKGCVGCLSVLVILAVIGFVAQKCDAGSAKKVISAYRNGNYEKVIRDGAGLSSLSDDALESAINWYVGDAYERQGSKDEATNRKIKAYNKLVGLNSEATEKFKKEYSDIYDDIVAFGQKKLAEQRAQKQKEQIVGTWVATSPSDYKGLSLKIYSGGRYENFHSGGSGKWTFDDGTITFKSSNGSSWTATLDGDTLAETTYEPGWGSMTIYYRKK